MKVILLLFSHLQRYSNQDTVVTFDIYLEFFTSVKSYLPVLFAVLPNS